MPPYIQSTQRTMTLLVGAVTLKAQEHEKDGTPSGI